jgi:hypothetical protein
MVDAEDNQHLQISRLVIAAMAMGIIGFAAVVVLLAAGGRMNADPQLADILLIVLAILAVAQVPVYVFVRRAILANLRRTCDSRTSGEAAAQELTKGFNALTITGGAMAEGLSLFGLVILLLSGNWLALAGPLVGLLLLAVQFPTRDKLRRFVESATGQHRV